MELTSRTPDQVAQMSVQDRVLYIQEARNKIAGGGELPDDIYATVIAVLRYERRTAAAATPAGKRQGKTAARVAAAPLSLDDL